jgi:hypothetical protein
MMRKTIIALSLALGIASASAQINVPIGPSGGASGSGGGSGTVTQIDTACGLSGGPITTTGTISGATTIRSNTGTTDTILSSDCFKVVTENNASAVAVTLPQATGSFGATWGYTQINLGAGTVTITPTTSTINGAATLTLTTGQSADITSDGTNYVAALGKGGGSGTVTTTGSPANGNLAQFSGATSVTNGNLSGDCTTSGTLAVTCRQSSPTYIVNNWYAAGAEYPGAPASNAAATNNTPFCYPAYFHGPATISALGGHVGTANAASNAAFAIYAHNASTFRPTGTPLVSTGGISTAATGVINTTTLGGSSASITSNQLVWFCSNTDAATQRLNGAGYLWMAGVGGSATQANLTGGGVAARLGGVSFSQACCTWGDVTAASFTELAGGSVNFPTVQFKIGSVP